MNASRGSYKGRICPSASGRVRLLPFEASIFSTRQENRNGGQQKETPRCRSRADRVERALRGRLLVEEIQDHAGEIESRRPESRALRQESGGLYQAAEAQGRRPGTDRDEPALRSQLLVEEVQGHARQTESRGGRRWAFVEERRRLPHRQQEERQESFEENRQEARKEKGRIAGIRSPGEAKRNPGPTASSPGLRGACH